MELTTMYESLGVSRAVYEYGEMILDGLRPRFEAIDRTAEYNQTKVLAAMQKNKLSAGCFAATTGYGYDDMGREVLEKVYADCFHTEAALVRPQITCGTHALAVALSANLLPGDELLSPNGAPYDTLEEVIGIRPSKCSLMEYGVQYRQVDLLPDGTFDFDGIRAAIGPKTKLITIQRSKGYATRPSFSVAQIGELIAFCKQCKPDVLCMVDNCYGEFVERAEPSDVGADMIVGVVAVGLTVLGHDVQDVFPYRAGRADGLADAVNEEVRNDAGIEASGANDNNVRLQNGVDAVLKRLRMLRHKTHLTDAAVIDLFRVEDFALAERARAVVEFGLQIDVLVGHRQDSSRNGENVPHPLHSLVKGTGNAVHSRKEEVSEALTGQGAFRKAVIEQLLHGWLRVGQRHNAVADIAGRQHPEILPEHSGAAAVVGDGHDGRYVLCIALEAAQLSLIHI